MSIGMEPRPYQKDARKMLKAARKAGERTALIVLPTGCHRKGQGILMYDGSIKKVEDIAQDDLLMGPDGSPREVLDLVRGEDEMVEVRPVKGQPWVVNKSHILSLVHTNERTGGRIYPSTIGGNIVDLSVQDWQGWSKYKKHTHKLFRVGVDFPVQTEPLPMRPYLLGAMLGDGHLSNNYALGFTNVDAPVVQEVQRIAGESGWQIKPLPSKDRAQAYFFTGGGTRKNHAESRKETAPRMILRKLGLLPIKCEHRFIPQQYKVASRKNRLALLAGLMDTDGYLNGNVLEYCSKSLQLANDVAFVSRSLGFAAYISDKPVNGTMYYRVNVSGDCSQIPMRLLRRKPTPRTQIKNHLRTGFTCVPTGTTEPYYGFVLDSDHRYLLDDFTVTHNCGKTLIMALEARDEARKGGKVLIIAHRRKLLEQTKRALLENAEDLDIGIVGFGFADWDHSVILGGVQTLTMSAERMQKVADMGFTLVLWDECHRLHGRTYQQLFRKVVSAIHQGYTATPNWHGGGSVASILGNPVYEQPLKDMILDKYLATPRVKIFRTRTTLAGIALHNGEFDEGELSAVVNCRNRNELIVETFLREGCKGKPTLAFCVSRQHARDLAACFRDHGVSAEAVVDDRNNEDREGKFHRYETRETNVLCSVAVIEEGFDAPQTEVLVMAAPTMSLPRHTQRFGRGTRMAFDKTEFWVLDFTDNSEMHDLDPVTIADVLDLPELLAGEDVIDAIKKDKKKKERAASEPQEEGTSPEKVERVGGEVSSQSVNVLKSFPWHKVRGGGYQLTVHCADTPQKIAIMPNDKSGYDVALVLQEHILAKKKVTLVEQGLALSTAQSIAEKKAKLLQAGKFHYVDPDASWRKNAPTAPQRARLDAMHIPIPATAGQAEALLTKRFARRGRAKKQETTS
jgi:superfamily II DNA or RNA helicase